MKIVKVVLVQLDSKLTIFIILCMIVLVHPHITETVRHKKIFHLQDVTTYLQFTKRNRIKWQSGNTTTAVRMIDTHFTC